MLLALDLSSTGMRILDGRTKKSRYERLQFGAKFRDRVDADVLQTRKVTGTRPGRTYGTPYERRIILDLQTA
jgi:hypothetical protein